MSYTKLTDFAAKDALLSGNPSKLLRGTEIDAEFAALETADALNAKTGTGVSFSSINDTGNLTFTGTGNRITGDFSNATVANRVMFQTSTVNGATALSVIPNGTAVNPSLELLNASDPTNASSIVVSPNATEARFISAKTGTGTYLPMTFSTGGSERVRIDTSGNVGIGAVPTAGRKLDINAGTGAFSARFVADSGGAALLAGDAAGIVLGQNFSSGSAEANIIYGVPAVTGLTLGAWNGTTYTQVAQFGATGGLALTSPQGLGYGTGSGGTVTQATSKSTAVTLNKPTGKITTAADALAPSARVSFLFNNSLIGVNDVLVLMPSVAGGNYNVQVIDSGTGVAYIEIFNKSGVSQAQAIDIKFAIIKGSPA